MLDRLRESWKNPASRGFIMLAWMMVAYGFTNSVTNGLITNYFDNVLKDGRAGVSAI